MTKIRKHNLACDDSSSYCEGPCGNYIVDCTCNDPDPNIVYCDDDHECRWDGSKWICNECKESETK